MNGEVRIAVTTRNSLEPLFPGSDISGQPLLHLPKCGKLRQCALIQSSIGRQAYSSIPALFRDRRYRYAQIVHYQTVPVRIAVGSMEIEPLFMAVLPDIWSQPGSPSSPNADRAG